MRKIIHTQFLKLSIGSGFVKFSGTLYDDGTTSIQHSFDGFYGECPVGHFNVAKGYKIIGSSLNNIKDQKLPEGQIALF